MTRIRVTKVIDITHPSSWTLQEIKQLADDFCSSDFCSTGLGKWNLNRIKFDAISTSIEKEH